jgi:hypothetical protein
MNDWMRTRNPFSARLSRIGSHCRYIGHAITMHPLRANSVLFWAALITIARFEQIAHLLTK